MVESSTMSLAMKRMLALNRKHDRARRLFTKHEEIAYVAMEMKDTRQCRSRSSEWWERGTPRR